MAIRECSVYTREIGPYTRGPQKNSEQIDIQFASLPFFSIPNYPFL